MELERSKARCEKTLSLYKMSFDEIATQMQGVQQLLERQQRILAGLSCVSHIHPVTVSL